MPDPWNSLEPLRTGHCGLGSGPWQSLFQLPGRGSFRTRAQVWNPAGTCTVTPDFVSPEVGSVFEFSPRMSALSSSLPGTQTGCQPVVPGPGRALTPRRQER